MRSRLLVALGGAFLAVMAAYGCAEGGDGSEEPPVGPGATSTGSTGVGGAGGDGGGSLTPNGVPCSDAATCISGMCVDGVCCDDPCDGLCESCVTTGFEGTCRPFDAGTDPEEECALAGCDGAGACLFAEHLWSAVYGDLGEDLIYDVVVDSSDNLIAVGHVRGGIDFGGGTQTAQGGRDIFIAKLDPSGGYLWSKVIGESVGSANQIAWAVATDSQDRVVVVGGFADDVDFGSGTLSAGIGSDAFVAVYDSAGNHVWTTQFGQPASGGANTKAVAVAPNGDIVVAGDFNVSIDVLGNILDDGSGTLRSLFLVKLTSSGTHVWSSVIGDAMGTQEIGSLDIASNGDVIVAGSFEGTISFGLTNHISAGSVDAFVARLDSDGNHVWSRRFGDAVADQATSLALDSAGDAWLVGHFAGNINFGGGDLTSAGSTDVYVAKLAAADGSHLFSARYGNGAAQRATDVVVDSGDYVLVSGTLEGSIDFGGGNLSSAGGQDAFLAKLASDGGHAWSLNYGDAADLVPAALSITSRDETLIGLVLEGTVDLGGGPLTSAGQADVALGLLGP